MEQSLTTRAATRQYRLRQWQAILHDRAESGLSVKEYCLAHNITKDCYYYWQKLVREAAIAEAGPVFAEIKPEPAVSLGVFIPQITVQIGNAVLAANSDTPEDLLMRAVRALKNAE